MKTNIFDEKNRIGNKIQPSLSHHVSNLINELKLLDIGHPYDPFDDLEFRRLFECCESFCRIEKKSIIPCNPKTEYLYRIAPASQFGKYDAEWSFRPIDGYDFYNDLVKKQKSNYWLNLGDYLNGFIKNRRSFSWWTDIRPITLELIYTLGLPRDWLYEKSVLLRVKVSDIIDQCEKPNIIDGFDQEIFLPTSEDVDSPGKTLNLNNLKNFEGGLNEYVIPEINVKLISVAPLKLDLSENLILLENIEQNLLDFYKTR